ncbi:unnamed protein product [Prunus armeniaca]|uniref:Uncharacterized protein n=1 Tax=Prunus armeniaca TaxID=36596 RepID=A0A6J5VMJ4_PRUAR|nr:unnamed protein product [Prunus armeniaca]
MARRLHVMGIPEGAVADDTDANNMSLYICTHECTTHHARYDIRAIRLSDLSSILKSKSQSQSKFTKSELLRKLAFIEGDDVPYLMGCGLFGSQILLAGGQKPPGPEMSIGCRYGPYGSTQIYLFETDDDDEKRKEKVYNHGNRFGSSPPFTPPSHDHIHSGGIIKGNCCYGKLHQVKAEPLVVEVGGKLFVLSGGLLASSESPIFEEFNPCEGSWTTLPDPPDMWRYTSEFHYFSCAIVGTKIMVSTPISPVFCFDVAGPNPRQWSVCSAVPFPFKGMALVLDSGLDDNCSKIVFGYEDVPGHGDDIVAYMMFNDNENGYCSWFPIAPLNLLTEFSKLVLVGGPDDTFSFVHLGGGKVCFAGSCFTPSLDPPVSLEEDMNLIVVTFEFSISDKDSNSARILAVKALGFCIFPLDFASEEGKRCQAKLLGCFVR